MKEQRYDSGQVIYQEGDPGDALFVITEGEVEVLRGVGRTEVRLAVLRKGAIFGEMGVIRNLPRSTTVRAMEAVTLITVPREAFLDTFQRDNPLALAVLRMLCERLLRADLQLMVHQIYSEGARLSDVDRIRLLPASPEMQTQIGSDGLTVEKLPFHVGRHVRPGESPSANGADLALPASAGAQISPLQFVVEENDGRLAVRDLDSHLGTVVNDRRIAHFEQSDAADLRFGENVVQAGGLESAYRFRIIVERAPG